MRWPRLAVVFAIESASQVMAGCQIAGNAYNRGIKSFEIQKNPLPARGDGSVEDGEHVRYGGEFLARFAGRLAARHFGGVDVPPSGARSR